jgi:hypothetical protein
MSRHARPLTISVPATETSWRQATPWLAAMMGLILLAALSTPAFPMSQEDTEEASAPEDQTARGDAAVEEILRQQEQLLRGQQFSYDPENRRDPFRSLIERVNPLRDEVRPPGVTGMLVSEIDLAGIVQDAGSGNVAFFTGSDNKGYFLRVGERVYDATLISIDAERGSVTFRQEIDDPRQIKPYRDVVRKLVPLDEESNR